ncbi:MAG: hypothetical protein KDA20_07800 [Phycisphaerales bacterium]|nr:hypothetical protein [Phycisphaerales bacterium]
MSLKRRKLPIWETQLDLSPAQLKQYENLARNRHRLRGFIPAVIGAAVALSAVPITGVVLGFRTPIGSMSGFSPLTNSVDTGGAIAMAIALPAVLGIGVATLLYRRWMHPIMYDYFTRPRCFHCGYDLKDLAHHEATYTRCPECGQTSPRVHLPAN